MSTEKIEANFSALVVSIGHSAAIAMGYGIDPTTRQTPEKNLKLASFNIDLLLVLRDKTKNNLTPDERTLLEQVISDLQMKFIQTKE